MELMTGRVSAKLTLDGLVGDALRHLEKLNYAPSTLRNRRSVWGRFLKFARGSSGGNKLTEDLVARFLASVGVPNESATPRKAPDRWILVAMRTLSEFAHHGCYQLRCKKLQKVKLPAPMKGVLSGYEQFCVQDRGLRSTTMRKRMRYLVGFLHFLHSQGVSSLTRIRPALLSEFMCSQIHMKPRTLAGIADHVRSFLRYLCMRGVLSEDLTPHIPKIRVYQDAQIPSVWRQEDVGRLLAVVDRASPQGKRDYAILLLAARLGLRVGDIRMLRLEDLRWNEARIDIRQSKTNEMLTLPLTQELGDALIDYLKHGRPATDCREVFLRLNAPFSPFGCNSNLHNLITSYRQRAGITLPARSRCGLHSLRHTVASRLLEVGTPLATIAKLLGHSSQDSTRVYTKINVEGLRSAALDTDEVTHE